MPITTTLALLPGERSQSSREEQANTLSHGLGFVLAAAAWPVLSDFGAVYGGFYGALGAGVFAWSMMFVYLASMVYHALPPGRAKRWARRIDHAAIFVFIAGSYTPFALGPLRETVGWPLLAAIWSLAVVGVACKVFGRLRRKLPSTLLYASMGWLALAVLDPLIGALGPTAITLLVAGGVAYTFGALFFMVDDRLRYGHFIWHLFVLAGSACHVMAALSPIG